MSLQGLNADLGAGREAGGRGHGQMGKISAYDAIFLGVFALVAIYGIALKTIGLGRSLWLDEAWEANAILAPSISAMFYHSSWLPTCPPPFLLMERAVVGMFGLTNWSFRLVPSVMGLLSCVSMVAVAARLFSRRFAFFASAMFILSPLSNEYSRTLKQYSTEQAITATILLFAVVYLERATLLRFWFLAGGIIFGLLIAYPVVFLLPGVVLVVLVTPIDSDDRQAPSRAHVAMRSRALILTASTAAILLGEYLLFIGPNLSGSALLRLVSPYDNGLAHDCYLLLRYLPIPDHFFDFPKLLGASVVFLLAAGFVCGWSHFRNGKWMWLKIQFITVTPCLLLMVADRVREYPMVARTGLFLLPCVVVLGTSCLQLIAEWLITRVRRNWLNPLLDVAVILAVLVAVGAGLRSDGYGTMTASSEDYGGAVEFLHEKVQPADVLWVHASANEGFKVYARMKGWNTAPVKFGDTGWPCCAREATKAEITGSESAVRDDLGAGIPLGFSGRIWLLYTERPTHWQFLGLDESQIMRAYFVEQGCLAESTHKFEKLAVTSFACGKNAPGKVASEVGAG